MDRDELYDDDIFEDDDYEDDQAYEPEDPTEALMEQHKAALAFEVQQYQHKLGRNLTADEVGAVLEGAAIQFARGQAPDVAAALEDVGRTVKPVAEMDHGERVAYMTERLRGQQPSAEEAIGEDRELDLDNPQDRVDYMMARLEGAEFEDVE
jgi:hypothetical protein